MARTAPAHKSPPVVDSSLDEQIALAEHAVIARDARIRQRSRGLVLHVKRTAMKNAGGGALLGLATMGLAWWLHRRRPAVAPAAPAQAEAPSVWEHLLRDAALGLAGLLPVLWPMLPRVLRRHLTPGTAGTALTFFTPLVGRLFRRRRRGVASR